MIDIDAYETEIPCPRCDFYNPVYLRQIRLRDVIICRGCKSNIQLEDYMNEMRKGEQRIRRSFQDLERTLSKLGNIKIEL